MIKSILVCTDGSAYGDTAREYGIALAKKLKAKLLGLHVLDSRMLEGPLMADISGWVGAQPFSTQLSQFRDLLEQKGEAVVNAFNERCEKEGITPEVWLKMGHPAQVMKEEEAHAELVVLGQKGEHAEWMGDMMGSNVEHLVRRSVKPCLVTPAEYKPVQHVIAAFDGSDHASQALHVAIELVQALDQELRIVTVDEGNREQAEQTLADGVKLVEAHQCKASTKLLEGEAEEAILKEARAYESGLVVVGAYGHSRIRQMILGSTTTHLVAYSEMPVMLVR